MPARVGRVEAFTNAVAAERVAGDAINRNMIYSNAVWYQISVDR